RGARRERAVGGARDRARVAVAVVEAGVAQRRVAGVLDDDLVVHHLADFAGQGRGRVAAVRARDFLQLLDREGGLRRDFNFDRRRFVGDRRFTGRRRGDHGHVDVDAGAGEHVAAGVEGRFAGGDRALAGRRDRARVAFDVRQRAQRQRGVAGVLDGDLVFDLLAEAGRQFRGRVGDLAFKALFLLGFEGRRRRRGHVHHDRVGGVRDRRALAFGRRGGGGGGVAVGARRLVGRAQHVVAGVGGRGARRERAAGAACDRAGVAVAV